MPSMKKRGDTVTSQTVTSQQVYHTAKWCLEQSQEGGFPWGSEPVTEGLESQDETKSRDIIYLILRA